MKYIYIYNIHEINPKYKTVGITSITVNAYPIPIILTQTPAFSIANPTSMRFRAKVKENQKITLTTKANAYFRIICL